ncbi:hypothetical protein MHYP_G00060550 [Metynnis hypsauchen]
MLYRRNLHDRVRFATWLENDNWSSITTSRPLASADGVISEFSKEMERLKYPLSFPYAPSFRLIHTFLLAVTYTPTTIISQMLTEVQMLTEYLYTAIHCCFWFSADEEVSQVLSFIVCSWYL